MAPQQPPAAEVDVLPPATGSKEAIRRAAEELFSTHGYSATSVRDIARTAGVNPALVIRHFHSKEALFLATMRFDGGFRELLSGPIEGIGVRIVRRLLENQQETNRRAYYTALMRSAEMEEVRAYVIRTNADTIVSPLADRLTGPDAQMRAHLVSAQISGLLTSLWILEVPELTSAPFEVVVDRYGRAIQSLIDG